MDKTKFRIIVHYPDNYLQPQAPFYTLSFSHQYMGQLDKKIREAIRLKYARGRKEAEKDKRGIIGKRIVSIHLDKVQDITCKFGIWGRIFGSGDIEIEFAGTYGKIVFDFSPSPRKIQEKIEESISNFKETKRVSLI